MYTYTHYIYININININICYYFFWPVPRTWLTRDGPKPKAQFSSFSRPKALALPQGDGDPAGSQF